MKLFLSAINHVSASSTATFIINNGFCSIPCKISCFFIGAHRVSSKSVNNITGILKANFLVDDKI